MQAPPDRFFAERELEALALGRQEESIRLAVSDTGVGIREADLGKLFTAFSQIEDAEILRHSVGRFGASCYVCKGDIAGLRRKVAQVLAA